MSRAASTLPPEAIERLAPYVDAQVLRSLRARTVTPWTWVPRVLQAGAVTLGRDVCFKPGLYNPTTPRGLALIAHECVHVRQYREMGPLRFLLAYLGGAVRVRFEHDRHPMELEAEALQARLRVALAEEHLASSEGHA